MNDLAPIALFVYNRLHETQQTIKALKNNYLASNSDLFVFIDGPKDELDKYKNEKVKNFIYSISGFKTIHINESKNNKGLSESIISGVTNIVNKYNKIIVLEDDLVSSPNFLDFMNQALSFYKDKGTVQSINGYSLDVISSIHKEVDIYYHSRTFSWGWATWKDRWENANFGNEYFKNIISKDILNQLRMVCGNDIPRMLLDRINGKNDSWYVYWVFDHFIKNNLSIYPVLSKVKNIGFSEDGTHCKNIDSHKSIFDIINKRIFNFNENIIVNDMINRNFLLYFSKIYKFKYRLKLLRTFKGFRLVINELINRF